MTEIVHVHTMGSGFVGGQDPQWNHVDRCPGCGSIKSKAAKLCVSCTPRPQVKRDAETMDNHHRWEAALQAGWTEGELMAMRPTIPTWEQILMQSPTVVIERWYNAGA